MPGGTQGRSLPIRIDRIDETTAESLELFRRSWSATSVDHDLAERWEETLRAVQKSLATPKSSLGQHLSAESFALAFDLWLDETTQADDRRKTRRRSGAYFTPPLLVDPIIEHAVQAVLMDRIREALGKESSEPFPPVDTWSKRDRTRAEEAVLAFRACDPACGPATFLVAAGELLASRLALIRFGITEVSDKQMHAVRGEVIKHSLYGVDIHPAIAGAAQIALWLWAGRPAGHSDDLATHIVTANSLAMSKESKGFDWLTTFPEIFSRARAGFDVMIGNPPFANAIELEGEDALRSVKDDRSGLFGDLSGTADLAYYFLALANRLTTADGAVGFVLPRAVLNTGSVRALRERLLQSRPPVMIHSPSDPLLFRDANIFITSLVLRGRSSPTGEIRCLVSRDSSAPGETLKCEAVTITSDNWWSPLLGERTSSIRLGTKTIEDRFEIWGSMTTGMAYDLLPFVREEQDVPAPSKKEPPLLRLITTGLIDPGVCHWGDRECRYLKRRFDRPVINEQDHLPPTLRIRLERVRRPKILVAGLSMRVEAFLDREGICAGAVSTYTIVQSADDVAALQRLCKYLNSDDVTSRLQHELGATAMGGGRITLTKEFLRRLPMPR